MIGCAAVETQPRAADLEMEKKLVGRWEEVPKVPPDSASGYWILKEDHTFEGCGKGLLKPGQTISFTVGGKWSVRNAVLIQEVTKISVLKPIPPELSAKVSALNPVPPQLRWSRESIVSLQNGLLTIRDDEGKLDRYRQRAGKSVKTGGAHRNSAG
ncbi:MAG: hypothetical protein ACR2NX_08120 [Chthoniobacterales bacterium]